MTFTRIEYSDLDLVSFFGDVELLTWSLSAIWTITCTTFLVTVAVHLGVKMADTLSFTAKVDMVDF